MFVDRPLFQHLLLSFFQLPDFLLSFYFLPPACFMARHYRKRLSERHIGVIQVLSAEFRRTVPQIVSLLNRMYKAGLPPEQQYTSKQVARGEAAWWLVIWRISGLKVLEGERFNTGKGIAAWSIIVVSWPVWVLPTFVFLQIFGMCFGTFGNVCGMFYVGRCVLFG